MQTVTGDEERGVTAGREDEPGTPVEGVEVEGFPFDSGRWGRQRETGRDVGLERGEEPGCGGRTLLEVDEETGSGPPQADTGGWSVVEGMLQVGGERTGPQSGSVASGFVVEKLGFGSGSGVKRAVFASRPGTQRSGSGLGGPGGQSGTQRSEVPSEFLQLLAKRLWFVLELMEPPGYEQRVE